MRRRSAFAGDDFRADRGLREGTDRGATEGDRRRRGADRGRPRFASRVAWAGDFRPFRAGRPREEPPRAVDFLRATPGHRGRLRKAFSFDPEDFATIPRAKERPLFRSRNRREILWVERESFTQTPSYGRVWPEENRPLAAVPHVGGRLGKAGNRPPIRLAKRSEGVPDRLPDADGRPPSRTDPSLGASLGRPGSRRPRRRTYGASRLDGRPPGTRRRCTSRERTPRGRNGSRRSPIPI